MACFEINFIFKTHDFYPLDSMINLIPSIHAELGLNLSIVYTRRPKMLQKKEKEENKKMFFLAYTQR